MNTIKCIEQLIREERWEQVQDAIISALPASPEDHWLHTRLGTALCESGRYHEALEHVRRAKKLAPTCPLVSWDLACTLQAIGEHEQAIGLLKGISKRAPGWIAKEPCIGHRGYAKGLVADSHYRMMHSLDALGRQQLASDEFGEYLEMRGPGCNSIYPMSHEKKEGVPFRNWRPSGRK